MIKRYFDNWIQEKFTKGIEFHVIAVELFMLKQINKVYGSSTGDLLLVQIARELQKHYRFCTGVPNHRETVF